MSTTYAQKSSTVQKVAGSKAASLFDSSSQSESLQRKADMANNAAQRAEAPRPNNTGMPDNLKSGIESLSGFSMDDVRVHYNSSKPATVQALAYTQGTDIHVAPGQEKHLPHEAWHVAQQMAGRVSPTTNINGMPVNDNTALEHEADVMGEKAVGLNITAFKGKPSLKKINSQTSQRRITRRNDGVYDDYDMLKNDFNTLTNGAYNFREALELLRNMFSDEDHYISIDQAITIIRRNFSSIPDSMPATAFGVNEDSMKKDLDTNIATNVGTEETKLIRYGHNPTIQHSCNALNPLSHRLHPSIGSPNAGVEIMWVLTSERGLVFGTRPLNIRRPHPTLVGGIDPEVISAGTIDVANNQILEIRDDSGHFRPGFPGLELALRAFNALPVDVFHPFFRGFVHYKSRQAIAASSPVRDGLVNLIEEMKNKINNDRMGIEKIDKINPTAIPNAIQKVKNKYITLLTHIINIVADNKIQTFCQQEIHSVQRTQFARLDFVYARAIAFLDTILEMINRNIPQYSGLGQK